MSNQDYRLLTWQCWVGKAGLYRGWVGGLTDFLIWLIDRMVRFNLTVIPS